jgi:hypothetical protein
VRALQNPFQFLSNIGLDALVVGIVALLIGVPSFILFLLGIIRPVVIECTPHHPPRETHSIKVNETIGCNLSVRNRSRNDLDLKGPVLSGFLHLGSTFDLYQAEDALSPQTALDADWWVLPPGRTRRFLLSYVATRPSHAMYYYYRFVRRKGKDIETKRYRLIIDPQQPVASNTAGVSETTATPPTASSSPSTPPASGEHQEK